MIPTLLFFGSIPKLPLSNVPHHSLNQRQQFAAMESARKEMEMIAAAQRLKIDQKSRTKE